MLAYIRNRFHPLWRLRQFNWFRRLQALIDFPVSRSLGRVRVYFFWLRDLSYMLSGDTAEPRMGRGFDVVLQKFRPDCFVDIGANIGGYSWRAINLTDQVHIWMFEPDARNVELLARTIRRNDLRQITLHAVAVADRTGPAELVVDDISGTAGSILDFAENDWSLHHTYGLSVRKVIPCVELDSFQEQFQGKKVVIKIDVEGAEDLVVRGAQRVLKDVRPVIFIECYELPKKPWLADLNYRTYDFQEGNNYLAYPAEMEKQVEAEWLPGLRG